MKPIFFVPLLALWAPLVIAEEPPPAPASADEVNPFVGSHGKLEELRLQVETTRQENELLREQTERRRNQFELDNLDTQMEDELQESLNKTTGRNNQQNPEPSPIPIAVAPPPPPKPKPVLRLVGVIETDAGRQAILEKDGKTWTVVSGEKVEKDTVQRVEADRVVLSGNQTLLIAQGEHPVSTGETAAIEAGGVSDEMARIMGITAPQKAPLPRIGPTPARF